LQGDIESRYFVEAAAKALEVLESFDSPEEELSIMEVARRVRMTYSSTFRLLYTLEKRGYVMRRAGSRKYSRTPVRKRFRIGYAAADNHMKFSDEVSRSLVVAARNHGVDLIVKDNEANPPKALANVDSLLEEGIHLLIEYQLNGTVAQLIAAKCHDAKVPVIAITYAHPGAYYFGGNNYHAGELAGDCLCDFAEQTWKNRADRLLLLPAKGMGSTLEVRMTGVRHRVLKRIKTLKKGDVFTATPGLTTHDGYQATKEFLQQFPRSDARILIAALSDPLAIGASRAADKLGFEKNVVIVGQGGGRDGRSFIRRGGPFVASVAYFPDTFGERLIPLALKILAGEKVPLISYTDLVVLNRSNLDQYYPNADPISKHRVPLD
jgi:ribose transport system substrate-binding protein